MTKLPIDKNSRLLIAAFLTVIVLLVLFALNSCKKPNDHISLIVNESTLAKSPVIVHFANANSSSTIQPGDFDVTISGKDSALAQMDGGSTTNFKASHG